MNKDENPKRFDLEDRTFAFAKRVREFVKTLAKTTVNTEDGRQLIKASGSVGANYIEANEAFSKKDFLMRMKICRKESKESRYFLQLVTTDEPEEREWLIQEATELLLIFNSIIRKGE